jgi:hypothetical protein
MTKAMWRTAIGVAVLAGLSKPALAAPGAEADEPVCTRATWAM